MLSIHPKLESQTNVKSVLLHLPVHQLSLISQGPVLPTSTHLLPHLQLWLLGCQYLKSK